MDALEVLDLLKELKAYGEEEKILSSFIPAFIDKTLPHGKDEYLHGSLNLGGTISGRLSSSEPNLTNLPSSGTRFAKPVKQCFAAPKGYLMVGADFSSLEDRVNTLQTRDPNKLKVYTDGYDSHSLRAYAYFGEQMPDINPNSVESINSIQKKYPKLRQDSKMPTFALTYGGTWRTLVANGGFSEEEAKSIEENYHKLYKHSDMWIEDQLLEASKTGFLELAFGLRLRTPVLGQVVLNSERGLPKEAHKEKKSAGNAKTQSYCMLNTRAANDFMSRVWNSKWKYDVKPIGQIHDAIYLIIKNELELLHWVNINLIEAMNWCDLPELQHPTIKLEAELCLYYPSWAEEYKIPNGLDLDQLRELLRSYDL